MTAVPVDLPAVDTSGERQVLSEDGRGHLGFGVRARRRRDRAVADGAASERGDAFAQVEAIDDLAYLFARRSVVDESSVRQRRPLQQAPIARQHDSMLGPRDRDDLVVAIVVAVGAVETEEAQIA